MNTPVTISRIERTCYACPAQWDAWTDEGDYVYIRYRWGWLSVEISGDEREWEEDKHTILLEGEFGHQMSGFMSYDELRDVTKGVLVLPDEEH